VRFVVLVVNVAHCAPAHEFAIPLVLNETLDFNAAGLIHLVAFDYADQLSFGHF